MREPDRGPLVIQGGMGIAVSSWPLAAAVARCGQLGVVSGTALDMVLARRLQDGDQNGHLRRAIAQFPIPEIAERILARYFRPAGRHPGESYVPVPRLAIRSERRAQELTVLANFVEVTLAREGHGGPIGINYLEKIQMATPAAVYGAMLAGVDYVLMGAGIPRELPRLLDRLASGEPGEIQVEVEAASRPYSVGLDPREWRPGNAPTSLRRPRFLAIVSSDTLASYLARDAGTRPDGFVIEGHRAGGHNAPPRGRHVPDATGQPTYGPRDVVDVARVRDLGLPFWLAGSYGTPERLAEALDLGADGVQVGTLFALAAEAGLTRELRSALLAGLDGNLRVRTEATVSPTGFPFKVAQLPGTLADATLRAARPRLCDLGYLRRPFQRPDGSVVYRCPGEPEHVYVRKGGAREATEGVGCLCNALAANVGLAQTRRDGYVEQPMVTIGEDLDGTRRLLAEHPGGWTATDAVQWLTAGLRTRAGQP